MFQGLHPSLSITTDYHTQVLPPGPRPFFVNISVLLEEVTSVDEKQQVK